MVLKDYYTKMWGDSLQKFESNLFTYDALIDLPVDTRRGMILVARPPENVKKSIVAMLQDFQNLEPDQYYYPATDFHITIFSVIICFEGFILEATEKERYVDLLNNALKECNSFNIEFTGITASPGCLIIQGFPLDNKLEGIRSKIADKLKQSELQHNPDTRYQIQTAHSTVVRFKNTINQPQQFIDKIKEYRFFNFGSFEVTELELIYNDWYHRSKNTQILGKFNLKDG